MSSHFRFVVSSCLTPNFFIITSVPFSLWKHDGQINSWAAYSSEKASLLSALHTVPNVPSDPCPIRPAIPRHGPHDGSDDDDVDKLLCPCHPFSFLPHIPSFLILFSDSHAQVPIFWLAPRTSARRVIKSSPHPSHPPVFPERGTTVMFLQRTGCCHLFLIVQLRF